MELRAYLGLLQRRWWIVVLIFAIALAATAYFTSRMEPVYRAKSTYIVRLSDRASEERNIISALNTLTGRSEIAATYAGVANSSLIKKQAAEALGINYPNKLSVSSQLRSGTNILEVTVEGEDPSLVRDYTTAIGAQTIKYVEFLYETYRLEILDEAVLPTSPVRPNMVQNLTLGGLLGLVLALGLVVFMEYMMSTPQNGGTFNILDEHLGIYDMRYFRERLHQEMSRTRRHMGCLAVGLVNIDHRRLLEKVSPEIRLDAMRSVVHVLQKTLRNEDVMAAYSDTEIAMLLPELDGQSAKIAIERFLSIVSKVTVDLGGKNINLHGSAGIAPYYSGDTATADILMGRARNVLDSMKESTYGRVMVSTEGIASEVHVEKQAQSADGKEEKASGDQEQPGSLADLTSAGEGPKVVEPSTTASKKDIQSKPADQKKFAT